MSKKRPNKQVSEKRKAKMAKKSYYASDAAKRKWEEKKARKKSNNVGSITQNELTEPEVEVSTEEISQEVTAESSEDAV